MALAFNTTGPCIPGEHYMLPPERRLGDVMELIEARKFFTLHAGRQTGKTTSLKWLERHFEAAGVWRALSIDIEAAREQPDVTARAMSAVLDKFGSDKLAGAQAAPAVARPDPAWVEDLLADPGTAISRYITRLAELDPRPLLLLLDEADGLVGPAMVSFLAPAPGDGYIARRDTAPSRRAWVLVEQRQECGTT